MRALIVGTGSIGQRHVHNIRKLMPDVEFIFLRRNNEESDLSRSCNARIVGKTQEAVDASPNFAVIATPSALHIEALTPLIQAGIPFYIEKPVVTRQQDVQTLRSLIEDCGFKAPTLVGCNLRFLNSLKQVESILRESRLGTVVRANLVVGQWLPDWRPDQDYRESYSAQSALGGGVIFDLIHEIDLARWWFGEFDRIYCISGKFSSLEIDSMDTAVVVLGKYESAPAVSISLDYVSREPVRRYEIVGDQATLIWDWKDKQLQIHKSGTIESIDCGGEGFDMPHSYYRAMQHFLSCVEQNRDTSQNILDGLNSTELAIRAKSGEEK